jgi:hypothetical protein
MSVPPAIMQALQAGGAAAPGGAGPGPGAGGPPPSITLPGPDPQDASSSQGGGDGDGENDLHEALDALHAFLQDDQDHVDKAQIAKCIAIVQGILGSRQKGSEAAIGITASHKAMSRAYAQ